MCFGIAVLAEGSSRTGRRVSPWHNMIPARGVCCAKTVEGSVPPEIIHPVSTYTSDDLAARQVFGHET